MKVGQRFGFELLRRGCSVSHCGLSQLPPFARCAKDGAPTVLVLQMRSKAWATRAEEINSKLIGAASFATKRSAVAKKEVEHRADDQQCDNNPENFPDIAGLRCDG